MWFLILNFPLESELQALPYGNINCKSNRVELAYRDELECFPNSVQVSTRAYSTPNSKFCMVYLDTDIVVSGVSVCRNLSSTSLVSIPRRNILRLPGNWQWACELQVAAIWSIISRNPQRRPTPSRHLNYVTICFIWASDRTAPLLSSTKAQDYNFSEFRLASLSHPSADRRRSSRVDPPADCPAAMHWLGMQISDY